MAHSNSNPNPNPNMVKERRGRVPVGVLTDDGIILPRRLSRQEPLENLIYNTSFSKVSSFFVPSKVWFVSHDGMHKLSRRVNYSAFRKFNGAGLAPVLGPRLNPNLFFCIRLLLPLLLLCLLCTTQYLSIFSVLGPLSKGSLARISHLPGGDKIRWWLFKKPVKPIFESGRTPAVNTEHFLTTLCARQTILHIGLVR